MDNNQKKFGVYVFISTFSRNLIEIFIPIILYQYGYNLKEVIFYYFLVNLISLIITYPCISFSKKYNNRVLAIIGIIAFVMLQISLNFMFDSVWYLVLLACLFALYRRGYWISRRFYNLKVIKKEKISIINSLISIINQIGVITSSYIGSLFLDFINIKILTVIAIILFLISIVPLYLLKFNHERNDVKLEFGKTIKQISNTDLYLFGSYELLNVMKFLFPLYLFMYVNNTYQTVGFISLLTNLSIVIFSYVYGRTISGKKNYLVLSIFLVVIVFIFKANCTSYLLIIISFLEGISTKMYELSIAKEFYTLSKRFEYNNYNLVYEVFQNFFRTFVVFILLVFVNDIKVMIYITLVFIMFGTILKIVKTKN